MYFEETDLCVQLQKRNWKLAISRQSKAYHHVNSLKNRIPAKHFAFYFVRNNLYFWRHCFGIPAILQFPRMCFVMVKEVILPLRRAKNLGDFFYPLGYALAGLLDSIPFLFQPKTWFEKRLFKV
jgi:GT2 family glycosyltransferase